MPSECSGCGEASSVPCLAPQKEHHQPPKYGYLFYLGILLLCCDRAMGVITGFLSCFYRWKISQGCLWYMSLVWPPGYGFSPELSAFWCSMLMQCYVTLRNSSWNHWKNQITLCRHLKLHCKNGITCSPGISLSHYLFCYFSPQDHYWLSYITKKPSRKENVCIITLMPLGSLSFRKEWIKMPPWIRSSAPLLVLMGGSGADSSSSDLRTSPPCPVQLFVAGQMNV